MRIGIIGGGIAGLTLACALNDQLADTTETSIEVFEQANTLTAVGAGVSIGPRVLSKVPPRIAELIRERGTSMVDASVFTINGDLVYRGGWPQAPIGTNQGVSLLRSDLQDILLSEVAESATTRIHLGYRAVQFDTSDTEAGVLFDNGQYECFDILVACDGIWSAAATVINPDQRLRAHGSMALRAIVNHHDLDNTPQRVASSTHLWVGNDQNFLCYPVDCGRRMYVTAYTPLNHDVCRSREYSNEAARFYREIFSQADPRVVALLGLIRTGQVRSVIDRTTPSVLTKGRLVAIGDSAGAMCSHSAQGANTAMLSAVVLAETLGSPKNQSVGTALAEYEEHMLGTVRATQKYARTVADAYHNHSFSQLPDKVNAVRKIILSASGTASNDREGLRGEVV